MMLVPVISVVIGIITGIFIIPSNMQSTVQTVADYALLLLIFGVGIDLGLKQNIWQSLKKLGLKIFLVPLGVVVGTLTGSIIAGFLLQLPIYEALAIGSGFGWYSLSGVILSQQYSIEAGTLSFMTNLAREFITLLSVPFLAKKVSYLSAVAPGGATTMDTTLPLISQSTKSEMTMIALINGVVLSTLVPILVEFFIYLEIG